MTERDDILLKQFFGERKQEIADEGFSRRVLNRLPDRAKKLSGVWMSFCSAVALVLFFALDGLYVLSDLIRQVFISTVQFFATHPTELRSILIAAVLLLGIGFGRLLSTDS